MVYQYIQLYWSSWQWQLLLPLLGLLVQQAAGGGGVLVPAGPAVEAHHEVPAAWPALLAPADQRACSYEYLLMEEGLGNLATGQVLLLLGELEHLDEFNASQALSSCSTLKNG